MNALWIAAGLLAALLLWLVWTYNRLVRLRNESNSAFSGIDVQLKRRAELIPNLVETVKGYAAHERGVFDEVTRARAHALSAGTVRDAADADREMQQGVGRLLAVAEAYPELKASQNFLALQDELRDTEDKVAAARRYYNAVVLRLNTMIQSVPSNVVAGMFRFAEREFYRPDDADSIQTVPAASFGSAAQ